MAIDIEFENKIAIKWQNLKSNAEERELEFFLSLQDVRKLLSKKCCYYTGTLMDDEPHKGDSINPARRTIDRVDSSKGYVQGNVVACCHRINQLKSNGSLKDFKAIIKGTMK